jgi:N-acetylmuramoyl-L-alanine amidase
VPGKPKKLAAPLRITLRDTSRYIDEIIIHCAATPEGRYFDVRDVTAWHKQRGWDGCGYHFVSLLDGTIQEGRPIGQQGIHTAGRNKGTVGVCYIGGLTKDGKTAKDTRTPAQKASLLALVKALKAKYRVARISGHNQ